MHPQRHPVSESIAIECTVVLCCKNGGVVAFVMGKRPGKQSQTVESGLGPREDVVHKNNTAL